MAPPARSVYLVAESHPIAKPLIAALELKRSDELAKLRCYASRGVLLVESRSELGATGRGRRSEGSATLGAGVTTGYLLGRCGFDASTRLFHLGRCEARDGAGSELIGQVVLANRVRDGANGRGYFPDLLLAHEFHEAGIETGAGASSPGGDGAPPLVDRELAGFLAAALAFLAPHQVYCLEAVGGDEELFGKQVGAILRLIDESARLCQPAEIAPNETVERSLASIAESLRLTAAQRHRLRGLALAGTAQRRDVAAILEPWCGMKPPHTKEERRRAFGELERAFRSGGSS